MTRRYVRHHRPEWIAITTFVLLAGAAAFAAVLTRLAVPA